MTHSEHKKIISKITDTTAETSSAVMNSFKDVNSETMNEIGEFTFFGTDVDTSQYNGLKSAKYDIFEFCASLIYYHGSSLSSKAIRHYLYDYNYISEDTMIKIISEFVDSIMISLIFQIACARSCKEDKITLTTNTEDVKS